VRVSTTSLDAVLPLQYEVKLHHTKHLLLTCGCRALQCCHRVL